MSNNQSTPEAKMKALLEELEKTEKDITKANWRYSKDSHGCNAYDIMSDDGNVGEYWDEAEAKLMCVMKNNLPQLLAYCKSVEGLVEALEKFDYCNCNFVGDCRGCMARIPLKNHQETLQKIFPTEPKCDHKCGGYYDSNNDAICSECGENTSPKSEEDLIHEQCDFCGEELVGNEANIHDCPNSPKSE